MTTSQWLLIAFNGTIGCLLLILALRYAGRRLANWAAQHIERMCAEALARPIPAPRTRDWDAEMMELVAAEQKRGDA
jgi:hypothetical protein